LGTTGLKGAPSSFRVTGDVILSAPHVAATALLHHEQGRNQLFISGGEQFSWNFIRRRHRAYSTVVQLFRKRSHIIMVWF